MSDLKLELLCLYSTWNNDLMIQDWLSFGHLIHADYGDSLNYFVSWAGDRLISTGYTWFIWHGYCVHPCS